MKFNLEKYRSIGGFVKNGTPKFSISRKDLLSRCENPNSPIATMLRDRVMYRNIKEGNPSDKVLKKDAHLIQQSFTNEEKKKSKAERFEPVKKAIENYKRRYHVEPI